MNYTSTKNYPNEILEVKQKLQEFFETLPDKEEHRYKRSNFDEQNKTFTIAYDFLEDKGYSGKDLVLNLVTMQGKEIDHSVMDVRGSWKREDQSVNLFSLDVSVDSELYNKIQALLPPTAPEEENQELEAENEHEREEECDFDDSDYPAMKRDVDGFYSGVCKCGGTTMPMYDEQPFWIAFCNRCDKRWENSDSSPLPF